MLPPVTPNRVPVKRQVKIALRRLWRWLTSWPRNAQTKKRIRNKWAEPPLLIKNNTPPDTREPLQHEPAAKHR